MSKGMIECFRAYGAKPKNQLWAFTALTDDGREVVACLWASHFVKGAGLRRYADRFDVELNNGGRLLREHLKKAQSEDLPIRLIVITAKDPVALDVPGRTAHGQGDSFHTRPDAIGRVTRLDDEGFEIEFSPRMTTPSGAAVVRRRH